jgi:hypothetical protein
VIVALQCDKTRARNAGGNESRAFSSHNHAHLKDKSSALQSLRRVQAAWSGIRSGRESGEDWHCKETEK